MTIDYDSTHPNYLLSVIAGTERAMTTLATDAALWTPERIAALQRIARQLGELYHDLNYAEIKRLLAA